jgi:hypothetical protein
MVKRLTAVVMACVVVLASCAPRGASWQERGEASADAAAALVDGAYLAIVAAHAAGELDAGEFARLSAIHAQYQEVDAALRAAVAAGDRDDAAELRRRLLVLAAELVAFAATLEQCPFHEA